VTAEDIRAPQPLPDFRRSTVDGFAVRARDTYGASDSLPVYLVLAGEVPMGTEPGSVLRAGECMTIHTGGMLPEGADAVVMLEYTQTVGGGDKDSDLDSRRQAKRDENLKLDVEKSALEVEMSKSVAVGENVIAIGEDVAQGQVVQSKGSLIRPAEIGGLMALGITEIRVSKKVRVGLISSGDEIIPPEQSKQPGQVRDVNSYTLAALVTKAGGEPVLYGIIGDTFNTLKETAAKALAECDLVVITAGSSASTRDMTADVIDQLGEPGVLVHGINTRPGKPTILGMCGEKAVIGLPGNPVSALVNGYLFVVPVIERLLGANPTPEPTVQARLSVNLPSQAGREDWWPVRLTVESTEGSDERQKDSAPIAANLRGKWLAEPIFGKSNLIFTLATADGLLRIPPDATGLSAGEVVEVKLL
jgi:molybdopterin molybdotransferase